MGITAIRGQRVHSFYFCHADELCQHAPLAVARAMAG
jgi:hypothetical protein